MALHTYYCLTILLWEIARYVSNLHRFTTLEWTVLKFLIRIIKTSTNVGTCPWYAFATFKILFPILSPTGSTGQGNNTAAEARNSEPHQACWAGCRSFFGRRKYCEWDSETERRVAEREDMQVDQIVSLRNQVRIFPWQRKPALEASISLICEQLKNRGASGASSSYDFRRSKVLNHVGWNIKYLPYKWREVCFNRRLFCLGSWASRKIEAGRNGQTSVRTGHYAASRSINAKKSEAERESRKKERMEKEMKELKQSIEQRQLELKEKQKHVSALLIKLIMCYKKICMKPFLAPENL